MLINKHGQKFDGSKVMSKSSFARGLLEKNVELPKNEIIIVTDQTENRIAGVYIPYEIWFQIQHFVHRIIER